MRLVRIRRTSRFGHHNQVIAGPAPDRRAERGQIVVLFAAFLTLFLLLCATIVDVSWYWTSNLRMQRAADAAALAGVVFLPGDPTTAYARARAEAAKNGYTDGANGITVMPLQDPSNPRRLRVTIRGPVSTYFAQIVGIQSFPAMRAAKADFVLPVPMGSPQNYYGIGYLVAPVTTTTTSTSTSNDDSGLQHPGNASNNSWQSSSGSIVNAVSSDSGNSTYLYTTTNNAQHIFGSFALLDGLAGNQQITSVRGIQVLLSDTYLSNSCSNSRVRVHLSWDGGSSWTTSTTETSNLGTTNSTDYTLGSSTSVNAWQGTTWNQSKLSDSNFLVRLTAIKGCSTSNREIRVDELEVRVYYTVETTTVTTTTELEPVDVSGPYGDTLAAQKFWGAMQSQGSPSIQGDAFMTRYDVRTSILNSLGGTNPDTVYDPVNYYNYAVEIPAGASGGEVWVFDPGFCDATTQAGTGEYFQGSNNPISAFFDLYDTNGSVLDLNDDTLVASTADTFRRLQYQDHEVFDELGRSTDVADCAGQGWHFNWFRLASGLGAGTYRLHTHSNDVNSSSDQNNSQGLNAFGLYATASGGTPRIYGQGAMEAYVRLPGGQASEFYLAQIEAVHAGKTMEINLWDPGDTGSLSADLQILAPTSSGWAPTTFDYQGTKASSDGNASDCNSRSGTSVTSVTTNTGGSSRFNGCWLTITVALPQDYSAPTDPVSGEDGWWKIRYQMGGSTSSFSTDLTTWKVNIRGNPVHLVLP